MLVDNNLDPDQRAIPHFESGSQKNCFDEDGINNNKYKHRPFYSRFQGIDISNISNHRSVKFLFVPVLCLGFPLYTTLTSCIFITARNF